RSGRRARCPLTVRCQRQAASAPPPVGPATPSIVRAGGAGPTKLFNSNRYAGVVRPDDNRRPVARVVTFDDRHGRPVTPPSTTAHLTPDGPTGYSQGDGSSSPAVSSDV